MLADLKKKVNLYIKDLTNFQNISKNNLILFFLKLILKMSCNSS